MARTIVDGLCVPWDTIIVLIMHMSAYVGPYTVFFIRSCIDLAGVMH